MVNKMKDSFLFALIVSFSLAIISCDGGPKKNGIPAGTPKVETNIANGKIFYETNCGGCHSATGSDDVITAFNATDLTKSRAIETDMSNKAIYIGTNNLMKRFSNIPDYRIKELKAYLNSL